MIPYFAQFPVVEIDRYSAQLWASRLYRSDFARYGDQWDWRARAAYAAFLKALQDGRIVPKSQLRSVQIGGKKGHTPKERPHPVVVINPFCSEKVEDATGEALLPPLLEPKPTIRLTTSSPVLPVRVTNPFVP